MGILRWNLENGTNELTDNLIIDDVQHMRIDIKMNMRKRRFSIENGLRAPPSTPKYQLQPARTVPTAWQENGVIEAQEEESLENRYTLILSSGFLS